MIFDDTTICAPATAAGGAIGVIRVSGGEAVDIVNEVFSKDISCAGGYTMHYGQIVLEGSVIDDVIVSVFRAPHSYTGEDSVEISHHGSPFIQQEICRALQEKGCVMAKPGEFTQRAFLTGKMDLTQAEAVADLIASGNAAQHRLAMKQMRGGISEKLKGLRDRLLHLTSLLELELDFSDHEELEFADRSELRQVALQIQQEIDTLRSSFAQGNAIKNGIPVAIIGAPNVGKSTLLNALLRDDRAIVSDIQGTTRDVIEDTITLGGYLFRFIDTAGIRSTSDVIEKMGIERSWQAAEKAQVVIMLTEPGVPYPAYEPTDGQQVLHVMNKVPEFQALTGVGLSDLESRLLSCIVPESTNDVIITNERHKQALERSYDSITRSLEALDMNLSGDLVSEDLRDCIAHLSEVTGTEITPDEVLGNIFKHFCIGK